MGRKYLVVVDSVLLAGAASTSAALGSAGTTPTAKDILAERRRALAQLADAMLGLSSAPSPDLLAVSTLSAAPLGMRPAPASLRGNVQVLEALGTIVVDADDVDIKSLEKVIGLSVFEDHSIDQPDVWMAESAAVPARWHLSHVAGHGMLPQTGTGILAGVLDTGIDAAHVEFAGRTIHFAEFDSLGRTTSQVPRDTGSHGTHVCSLSADPPVGSRPELIWPSLPF